MALLPYFADYDPYYNVNRLFDQDFGIGLFNDDLPDLYSRFPSFVGLGTPFRSGYLRTLRHLQPEDSGVSSIENTKDQFKVSLDVQQFNPNEVKVKVSDNHLIIEGKHEERQDEHGFISREFVRKYHLPSDVKMDAVTSSLSSDGLLQIVALKKVESKPKEKVIKVVQTNKPAVKNKRSKTEKMEY